ncbi:hypothetical protein G9U51_05405 [Calidifontibacter sp. DB0510]|uniref:Tetratricopeptide repeat protein n=1 Tax=Metallococcus carri TaxID=1656884 RepID=A0A967AYW4_9MICO|nr:hypothetical protein [Metallococcus carri]NHN55223.1 hypothetical protein [Metallococcus carri]NOP36300.1 hypothetical protein [Calidifontibacter sp. DB2511S]
MLRQERLDELWDFADPQSSEQRLRGAADTSTDPDERAELQTQVARALGLQGEWMQAERELAAVTSTDPIVQARVALENGRVRNSAGDPAGAIPMFKQAAKLARRAGDRFLEVDALHMLAIADSAQAEAWTWHALAVAERGDARTQRWQVSLHNNLGWTHRERGDLVQAYEEFEHAADLADRVGTPEQRQWAREALAEVDRLMQDAAPRDIDED